MAGFHICAVTLVFYTQYLTNSWTSSMHFRQFSKMGFVDDKRIAIWLMYSLVNIIQNRIIFFCLYIFGGVNRNHHVHLRRSKCLRFLGNESPRGLHFCLSQWGKEVSKEGEARKRDKEKEREGEREGEALFLRSPKK